jgi:uncharacterized membrane protein
VSLAGLLLIWYLLSSALPDLKDGFANLVTAAKFLVGLLVVPIGLGWLAERLLNPLLLRLRSAGGLVRWEDRVVREFAPDEDQGFEVVIVPYPSEQVRSLGLVTNTFPDPEGEGELAAVFLPNTPKPMSGSLRIVPVASLEFTDWKLRDLMHYHASFGSSSPASLLDVLEDQPPRRAI